MTLDPERPYSALADHAEALPFRVRLATSAQDLQQAVEIRAAAYGRHLARMGDVLRTEEPADRRPDVLVLIAERKFDRQPVGSMRLEPNFNGPLNIEAQTSLPEHYRGARLVELTRLGVESGSGGTMVMVALAKAAYEICRACGVDYAMAVGRRTVGHKFRSLCFDEIKGPIRIQEALVTPLWLFALPVCEWETRLRAKGHFYFDFLARTEHPDITIDFQTVLRSFGVA